MIYYHTSTYATSDFQIDCLIIKTSPIQSVIWQVGNFNTYEETFLNNSFTMSSRQLVPNQTKNQQQLHKVSVNRWPIHRFLPKCVYPQRDTTWHQTTHNCLYLHRVLQINIFKWQSSIYQIIPVPDRGTGEGGTRARDGRALQQLALNVRVKHSELSWPDIPNTFSCLEYHCLCI